MKKILVFIVILSASLGLHITQPGDVSFSTAVADTADRNPNGSSELSLLMRAMESYTKTAREHTIKNNPAEAYPASFDKIYTAKISEGMSKSDFYNQFADLYISAVKNYAKSSPEDRINTYNNMVSACLACHSQHCPGPVIAIKKLMIQQH